jgi:opacity protein-like surface antigen
MKKLFAMLFVLALMSTAAMAQGAEVFGGYQFTRFEGGLNMNGWNGALEFKPSEHLGIVADFSGAYKSESVDVPLLGTVEASTKVYTFMVGPQVSGEMGSLRPFARALFGGARLNADASVGGIGGGDGDTAFAWALGGGLDLKVAPRVRVRVGQFDYLMTRFGGSTQNNVRYSAGLVFHF